MRTTVRLDPGLLTAAKRHALETGQTLTALIEAGLREVLAKPRRAQQPREVQLPTVGGRGVRPGLDMNDNSAVLDFMEGLTDE